MKIRLSFILLLIFVLYPVKISGNNSIGTINKIKFFHSISDNSSFMRSLSEFDFNKLTEDKKTYAINELEKIGDDFVSKGDLEKANIVFRAIANGVPGYWQIFNKIENIKRLNGSSFFNVKISLDQIISLLQNDNSLFAFLSLAVTSLYFSAIFVFFIFSIVLFFNNFNLFSTDALNTRDGEISVKKILFFSLALFWPLLLLSGWMIFPFLMSGLLWVYYNKKEKRGIITLVIIIFIFSSLFSVISFMRRNRSSDTFIVAAEVISGKRYNKKDYSKFDNELKVYLAYTFYKDGDFNSSLDILLSTGESYRSNLKYNLLGNIYYKSGNPKKSLKYYKNSLELNENDQTAIHNFTIVLASHERSKVFNSYVKRFPLIEQLKDDVDQLKEVEIDRNLLKRRIFNNSNDKLDPSYLTLEIIKEFMKLPIIWFSLILLLYIYIVDRFFQNVGKSVRCSKCNKITKRINTEKGVVFCNECHQLFKLKDVIFLEAKVAKEKKIRKGNFLKGIIVYVLSVFSPGIKLLFTRKYISFILFAILFYSIAIFSIAGKLIFQKLYSTYPIIFSISSLFCILMYILINFYSIKGDSSGI